MRVEERERSKGIRRSREVEAVVRERGGEDTARRLRAHQSQLGMVAARVLKVEARRCRPTGGSGSALEGLQLWLSEAIVLITEAGMKACIGSK